MYACRALAFEIPARLRKKADTAYHGGEPHGMRIVYLTKVQAKASTATLRFVLQKVEACLRNAGLRKHCRIKEEGGKRIP
jgi:hypothetical protein